MMPSLLFLTFTYFSEALIVFYFARSIYDTKYKPIISFGGVVFTYMLLMLVYRYVTNFDWINIISVIIANILVLSLLFQNTIKSALFHGIALAVLQIAAEFSTAYLLAAVYQITSQESIDNHFEIGTIISRLIYFLLSTLLAKISVKETNAKNWGKWFLFGLMPVSSVLTIMVFKTLTDHLQLTRTENIISISVISFLLIANIIAYAVYEHSEKESQKLIELEIAQQKNEMDMQYLNLLEERNQAMQILTHDYKNHLYAIRNMQGSEQAEYIDKITDELQNSRNYCNSGNHTLDIIVNKYITECELKKVDFNFDVKSNNLHAIKDYDLMMILGNALDNALEAASKADSGAISLVTTSRNNFDVIMVTNSCNAPPDKDLKSTKKNAHLHGLGMKSIAKALKNYDGDYEWEYNSDNKQFIITIYITNSD